MAFEIQGDRVYRPGDRSATIYTIIGERLYHRLLRIPMYELRHPPRDEGDPP